MKLNTIAMLALLAPVIAVLPACNRSPPTADDMAAPPAATTPPAETAPAATPYDTTPAPATDAATTTPSPSTAAGNDTSAGLTFEQMDKNHDGGITPDELSPTEMLYEHFSAADTDGNGQLSADEIVKHRADMAAATAPPAH
jgi:hypothetical protein